MSKSKRHSGGARHYGGAEAGLARLRAHVRACEECRRDEPDVEAVATALMEAAGDVPVASDLSARVMQRAASGLEALARRRYRRRVAAAIASALLPLPLVAVYGIYLMRSIYGIASRLLSDQFATYLVASYSATLLLLLALTYAAIPLMLEDRKSRGALASGAGLR